MIQYGRVNFLKLPFENWIYLKKLGKEIDLSHKKTGKRDRFVALNGRFQYSKAQ